MSPAGRGGNFKVTKASIVMNSRGGNRVKGFHFKYRVVPTGPGLGTSNWSANVSTSFNQGLAKSFWMTAGPQGQAWSPLASWALEIKLKYPRSLRRAYRYKYKISMSGIDCGVDFRSPGQRTSRGTHRVRLGSTGH